MSSLQTISWESRLMEFWRALLLLWEQTGKWIYVLGDRQETAVQSYSHTLSFPVPYLPVSYPSVSSFSVILDLTLCSISLQFHSFPCILLHTISSPLFHHLSLHSPAVLHYPKTLTLPYFSFSLTHHSSRSFLFYPLLSVIRLSPPLVFSRGTVSHHSLFSFVFVAHSLTIRHCWTIIYIACKGKRKSIYYKWIYICYLNACPEVYFYEWICM